MESIQDQEYQAEARGRGRGIWWGGQPGSVYLRTHARQDRDGRPPPSTAVPHGHGWLVYYFARVLLGNYFNSLSGCPPVYYMSSKWL
jgi:hypothetical protein